MSHSKIKTRILQIFLPMITYVVVFYVADALLLLLTEGRFGKLICILGAAVITLPVLYDYYRRIPVVRAEKLFDKAQLPKELLFIAGIALAGFLFNYVVFKFHLLPQDQAFEAANRSLHDGSLPLILVTDVIAIPLLEELLYRGIILGQLSLWMKKKSVAILLSAFFFGMLHFNIVQFVYAFAMGILLGIFYLYNHKLLTVFLAHALCNLLVLFVFGSILYYN